MALTNTQLVYIIIAVGILYLLYNNSKKNNKNTQNNVNANATTTGEVAKEPFSLTDTINNNLDKIKNSGFISSIRNIV